MQIENENTPNTTEISATTGEAAQTQAEQAPEDEGEFRLTIKKLEFAVRPRGVLAE